jgi:hypothetical protein
MLARIAFDYACFFQCKAPIGPRRGSSSYKCAQTAYPALDTKSAGPLRLAANVQLRRNRGERASIFTRGAFITQHQIIAWLISSFADIGAFINVHHVRVPLSICGGTIARTPFSSTAGCSSRMRFALHQHLHRQWSSFHLIWQRDADWLSSYSSSVTSIHRSESGRIAQ